MPKVKRSKANQPKKVKGGTVLGKEGELWFAIKCSNSNVVRLSLLFQRFEDPDEEDIKDEE